MVELLPELEAEFDQLVTRTDKANVRAVLIANKEKLVSNFVSNKESLEAASKSGLMDKGISELHADVIKGAFASPGTALSSQVQEQLKQQNEKLDTIVQKMAAKPIQEFEFSQSKVGKGLAVNMVLDAFQLASLTPLDFSDLPNFSNRLMTSQYVPFTLWGISPNEQNSSTDLCNHFRSQLAAFGEPMEKRGRFSLYDVRWDKNSLNFSLATSTGQLVFKGGTDAVIVPFGQRAWWSRQLRVIIDWKTPEALQALAYLSSTQQAVLEMLGGLANSKHPPLVVFTDGIDFVILQPYDISLRYLHTLPENQTTLSVLPQGMTDRSTAFRFIVHHLQNVSSLSPAFTEEAMSVNDQLELELRPLKRVKAALGVGEGLAEQIEGCKALPEDEQLDAISDSIKAWRMSYFS